ncbi:MAG TPA: RNA methyltransferase [Opitutaceae bacterium]|nr:RNA methyltransferase [Opitutaceae bacterium]
MQANELSVCGLAAVRALFAQDAGAIKRLYFDYPTGRRIGVICKALAAARKVYRCVEPAALEKIAGTVHHGGIVAVIEQRGLRPPRPEEVRGWARARTPLLLLDRIGNAHNLGAIVRTAAFFGVAQMVVPEHPEQALPSEATYRVAEGGMARVEISRVPSLAEFIRELRPFYEVIGAAVRGAAPLGRQSQSRTANAKPIALVLGNEENGLAPEVAAACDRVVRIPGDGAMDSLNVAAAAAVLCWEFFGRR